MNARRAAQSAEPHRLAGSLTLNVTLADTLNPSVTAATQHFTVAITFAPLSITSSGALGGFAPGAAVSATFTASGGSPAYKWTATGMPTTLALDPVAGKLTGTAPTKPGNYSFPLKVTDSQTPAGSDSTTVTFSVIGFSNPSTLPSGSTSTPYSLHFIGVGGTPPYTFSSANAPAGLGVSSGGLLSGTPSKAGTSSFNVQITDANGISVPGTFSLTVGSGAQPIQVTGLALPDGTATAAYSQTLEAQAGKPPYTWTVIGGALPLGLPVEQRGHHRRHADGDRFGNVYRASDGFLRWFRGGSIHDHDRSGTAAGDLRGITERHRRDPLWSPAHQRIRRICTLHLCYHASAALPSPLTFGNGQINSGVPTATGSSDFTVTVTDAVGNTASGAFTLVVEPTVPDLVLSQASVSFSIATNPVTLPAAANVTVGSSVAGSLGFTVLANPDAPWLDFTQNGNTSATLVIQLDPVIAPQLGAGTYRTTLSVACLPLPAGVQGFITSPSRSP